MLRPKENCLFSRLQILSDTPIKSMCEVTNGNIKYENIEVSNKIPIDSSVRSID